MNPLKSPHLKSVNFRSWHALSIVTIVIGIIFRFGNLSGKIYWEDEVYTSIRAAGVTVDWLVDIFYTNMPISIEELHRALLFDNGSTSLDVIESLVLDDNHPPLYFLLARQWVRWLGHSVWSMRAIAAIVGLFSFTALYALSKELFSSKLSTQLTLCLFAVSPIFVRYGQESRHYSLWVLCILMTNLFLLKAVRSNRLRYWLLYGASISVGLYVHLFSAFTFMGILFWVLINCRKLQIAIVKRFFVVSSIAILVYLPWIFLLLKHAGTFEEKSSWIAAPIPFIELLRSWIANFSHLFITGSSEADFPAMIPAIALVAFLIYLAYFLVRHAQLESAQLALLSAIIPVVILVGLDLTLGGRRSRNPQYFLSTYLFIQMAFAYCVARNMTFGSILKRKVWKGIGVSVILAGVVSCAIDFQASTWWGWSVYQGEICDIINESDSALVVSDARPTQIYPLSFRLKPDTHFVLVDDPEALELPAWDGAAFLYNPSPQLEASLSARTEQPLEPLYQFQGPSWTVSLYQLQQL